MSWEPPEERLTPESVAERVARIGHYVERGDISAASRLERRIWKDVLEAIADGGYWDKDQLAYEALQTKRYRFNRLP